MTIATAPADRRALLPILRRQLLEGIRGMIGWSLGIAAVMILYLPVYPSLQTPELRDTIDNLPPGLVDAVGFNEIATGAGYTQATFFGLLGFLLAVTACIAWGTQAIAGREDAGRLELTLAHAVGRIQYVAESAATLLVRIAALGLVAVLLLLVLNGPGELSLEPGNVLTAVLAWTGLCLFCGAAALTVGAFTGRPAWSVAAGATVAVLGYGLDAVGNSNQDLGWMAAMSPYHWAFGESPLATGAGWGGIALLWGLCVALFAVSCWGFSRRDISG